MATDVALQQAIQALRAGERAAAQTMLHTFTEAQPSQPDGWLWLAVVFTLWSFGQYLIDAKRTGDPTGNTAPA